ncbi:IclR family transcriptional regulator domain-containing protein, partial [Streptomyces bottropensis]|uniref:IclR family transcriptional regulator domain-containing protein n=1 Tax=Streptomyces bottropensis TaxID=42235 RepID=UPI003697F2D7
TGFAPATIPSPSIYTIAGTVFADANGDGALTFGEPLLRAQIREEGHVVTRSGVIPGIISVAAPVFSANDPLPLAVSVVLPESLGTPDHLAEVTRELRETVAAASHELGHLS